MGNEWTTKRLDELCAQIFDCPHSTPKWTDHGVLVLRSHNIRGGRLNLREQSFTDEETFEERSRRAKVGAGDLVITREAPMGEVCMVPENLRCCLGQRMVMLRADPRKCDGRFLLYSLQSPAVQHEIGTNEGTGSTVSNLRIPFLKALKIKCPPLAEQKRIAGILGALDDKIELNRKMNETLEQMARALFKSWFVDFDPVHANAAGRQPAGMDRATADLFPDSFVDSELGKIPKGWRVGTLDELVELRIERIAATPAKDGMRYLALENMPSRSLDVSQFQPGSAVNSSIIKFLEGDILLGAMRPYFHKVGLAFFDGITRSTTMVLSPKKCFLRHFALLHVFSDELIRYATTASIGTTMPYVKWDSLAKYQIIIPGEELLTCFDEQVSKLVIMIGNNGNESRLLAEIRDALIPQLLFGECNR